MTASFVRMSLMLLAFCGSVGVMIMWLVQKDGYSEQDRRISAVMIPTVVAVMAFALVAEVYGEIAFHG